MQDGQRPGVRQGQQPGQQLEASHDQVPQQEAPNCGQQQLDLPPPLPRAQVQQREAVVTNGQMAERPVQPPAVPPLQQQQRQQQASRQGHVSLAAEPRAGAAPPVALHPSQQGQRYATQPPRQQQVRGCGGCIWEESRLPHCRMNANFAFGFSFGSFSYPLTSAHCCSSPRRASSHYSSQPKRCPCRSRRGCRSPRWCHGSSRRPCGQQPQRLLAGRILRSSCGSSRSRSRQCRCGTLAWALHGTLCSSSGPQRLQQGWHSSMHSSRSSSSSGPAALLPRPPTQAWAGRHRRQPCSSS